MLRSICLTVACLLVVGIAGASGLVVGYEPLDGEVAHEDALLFYSNLERTRAGVPELARDEALSLAARHHAAEMARLRYMSHESPVAEHASLPRRVARAGSAVQVAGENIARVRLDSGSAHAAVAGWMESPGHRANLLNARFTHVGFGTAANGSGDLYVVQVLAHDPLRLAAADVVPQVLETPHVAVSFEVRAPGDVAVGYGEEYLPVRTFPAGRHTVSFPYAEAAPVHVRAGVRAPSASGGFIGQDGGWFDPAGEGWRGSDSFPRQDLHITEVAARPLRENVHRVTLSLAGRPPAGLGVWIDGGFMDFEPEGDRLVIDVPGDLVDPVIGIGLQDESDPHRYSMVLGFTLRSEAGAPRLHPLSRD